MGKTALSSGEVYHIYNRGVDKRTTFLDDSYYSRFYSIINHYLKYDYPYAHLVAKARNGDEEQSLTLNWERDVGDKRSLALSLKHRRWKEPLVEFISFNLLPNHFHFQVRQLAEDGITTFMHRLGTSYTNYFNVRNDRTGSLFQGTFKAVRVESEGQFLCLSRYIHVNPVAAGLVDLKNVSSWRWSSLLEYLGERKKDGICNTGDVLSYFKDSHDYLGFVLADFKEGEREDLMSVAIDDDFGWFEEIREQKKLLRQKLMESYARG